MAITRRVALKAIATAGATAGAAALPRPSSAAVVAAPADALGMLYDTTRCIGCKACVSACDEANAMMSDRRGIEGDLYLAPVDLNGQTRNIIKLYKEGPSTSFVKQQCMHCVDPACANACMLGALQKRAYGVVSYDASLCVGCRYCQMACPFGIPKFEWSKAFNPKIVKCELCSHRYDASLAARSDGFTRFDRGHGPACAEVCPRDAVIYGRRTELLAEARRRIAASPGRYFQDRIYGETEGGGTQVLYLSHVPFEKLGLPELGDRSAAARTRTVQHIIHQDLIMPALAYAALGFVLYRRRKAEEAEGGGGER